MAPSAQVSLRLPSWAIPRVCIRNSRYGSPFAAHRLAFSLRGTPPDRITEYRMDIGIQSSSQCDGASDFDFQRGEWQVRHRVKRSSDEAWIEFSGTCRNRMLIDGSANVEEHTFIRSAGITYGIALRAYDSKAGEWAIWWVDSRDPHGMLDPPVKGRFENGVGTFHSNYMADRQPMRLRFVWSHISADSARWEQAISSDDGETWNTNWTMEFERSVP